MQRTNTIPFGIFNRRVAPPLLLAAALAGLAQACVDDEPKSSLGGADAGATDASTADAASPTPDGAAADAGTDARPDGKAPFDPKSVPGLVLWLDPAAGVTETGGKVSAWKDSSGANVTVTQTNAANQPTKGTALGKPVIVGTASTWLEASGADVGTKLDFGDGDVLAELVVSIEPTAAGLGGVFYKVLDDAPPYNGLQMYGNVTLDGKPGMGLDADALLIKSPAGNMGDGKLHLVSYWRFGTNLFLSIDGEGIYATSAGSKKVVDNASPLWVGGRPSGVHSIAHKLGDVMIYKGPLVTAQVTEIEAFLKAKNGI